MIVEKRIDGAITDFFLEDQSDRALTQEEIAELICRIKRAMDVTYVVQLEEGNDEHCSCHRRVSMREVEFDTEEEAFEFAAKTDHDQSLDHHLDCNTEVIYCRLEEDWNFQNDEIYMQERKRLKDEHDKTERKKKEKEAKSAAKRKKRKAAKNVVKRREEYEKMKKEFGDS